MAGAQDDSFSSAKRRESTIFFKFNMIIGNETDQSFISIYMLLKASVDIRSCQNSNSREKYVSFASKGY